MEQLKLANANQNKGKTKKPTQKVKYESFEILIY